MKSFETLDEAQAFVRDKVDTPTLKNSQQVSSNLHFESFSASLEDGHFTNVYDLNYREDEVNSAINIFSQRLSSVCNYIRSRKSAAVSTGGFFFLADQCSAIPRQSALNFAVRNHQLLSLPVADRETVIAKDGALLVENIEALGVMSMNGIELSWSGSLTNHETDCKVFSNGNSVINHHYDERTESARVLAEASRYTPYIEDEDSVDIGFISKGPGLFKPETISRNGGLDIFSHDFIVRSPDRYLKNSIDLKILSAGNLNLDTIQGAFSAGPMFNTEDFEAHPINSDASLGSKPPFTNRRMARILLYKTEEDMVHIRLFDGRPGSANFAGVTPKEAIAIAEQDSEIEWGCFLDSGQTAKLCVRTPSGILSTGNTHYLKWPRNSTDGFAWTPRQGRPVASLIDIQ